MKNVGSSETDQTSVDVLGGPDGGPGSASPSSPSLVTAPHRCRGCATAA